MLKEAADELHHYEAHGAWPITSGLAIAERNHAVFHRQDLTGGEGHFEDVGGQVLGGVELSPTA